MKVKTIFTNINFVFCLLLPNFLLYPYIPPWAFYSSLFIWTYRLMIEKMEWRAPTRIFTGFLSLVLLGITYLSYDTLIGRDPSSTFLILLLSLKGLEYQSTEESGFLILLGLYLTISKFLYDTELIWFSLCFPTLILLIYNLLPDSFRKKNKSTAGLYVIKSILMSLPLALFFFFYFPRFSSDVFSFKSDESSVQNVGFAEEIEPGSVSSLIQNDEVVLRAEFVGLSPTVNNLYWRGLTLTEQSGFSWGREHSIDYNLKVAAPFSTAEPHVKVTMEPNLYQWIFSLDQTTHLYSDQTEISKLSLGIYKTIQSIDSRLVYNLKYNNTPFRDRETHDIQIKIKDPPSIKLNKFLKKLSFNTKKPEDIINNFSEYLVENNFKYTLSPGDQGNLTIDKFLFETKLGFCEHYAAATALILNYLNIPARVVTGYHGGEYNPVGQFWTIRQRDAHAWVEFTTNQKLWKRFDPTAVIAPMRLSLGSSDFAKLNNGGFNLPFKFLKDFIDSSPIFQKMSYYLENLNYRWNSIFVNFNIEKQKEILSEMNITQTESIVYGLLLTLVIALSLSWLLRSKIPQTRSQKMNELMNNYFEKYGLERKPTEGPEAWKNRTLASFPENSRKIQALFSCYIAEAYENKQSRSNLNRIKQLLRSL